MVHKAISPQDYESFRGFLEESCGIVLGDNKHYLVNSRLNRLMDEAGVASLGDLVKQLSNGRKSSLHADIVDAMTTNETYWFRDMFPFEIFKERLLPELAKKKQQRMRIWSAACSSGQEPYTLGMTFKEYQLGNPGAMPGQLEIMATDISPTMVRDASRGCYDNMSMARGLPEDKKQRYFKQQGDCWEVIPLVRSYVTFREHNLLQSYALLGRFDVIFCRNVLIYFSAESKRDILDRMADCLNPGGYLILGASESLASYSDRFEMVRCSPGVIYQLK